MWRACDAESVAYKTLPRLGSGHESIVDFVAEGGPLRIAHPTRPPVAYCTHNEVRPVLNRQGENIEPNAVFKRRASTKTHPLSAAGIDLEIAMSPLQNPPWPLISIRADVAAMSPAIKYSTRCMLLPLPFPDYGCMLHAVAGTAIVCCLRMRNTKHQARARGRIYPSYVARSKILFMGGT